MHAFERPDLHFKNFKFSDADGDKENVNRQLNEKKILYIRKAELNRQKEIPGKQHKSFFPFCISRRH